MTGCAICATARRPIDPRPPIWAAVNLRVIATGAGLIVLAAAFFFYMAAMAPESADPDAMMRTVGMVSGGAAGLGGAMILIAMFRRRRD